MSCAKKNVQIDLSRINPLEVLKKAKEGEESIRSVKGLASVSIKAPDRKVSYNQVTVAEEPNLLHLEAVAPFGRVVGMVFSDGAKIYVISPEEQRTFSSLHEFDFSFLYPGLPVKITVDDLVNLLLGHLPQEPEYEGSEVHLSAKSNYIVLTLLKNGKEESVLWINPLNYRIEEANINLSEGIMATCKFGDFKDLGAGVFFPKRIEFKVGGFSILVKYDEGVEVNGEIDRDLFKPKRPLARFEKPF